MTARVLAAQVQVGDQLPTATYRLTRLDLVRYAGASGDFNPIHWNESFATAVGLPDVIAHGMLTMAKAICVVTDWLGDPGAVLEYGVRFTRPVPVPNDDAGATIEVSAQVAELLDGNRARIAITASSGAQTVLGKAVAVVQLG
jgi:acyl dehydratase